ncbi:thioredoxin family protein [Zhouia sp. PK063]|uniref:thioredoxin family protein n=1 Tax=Zhouia sp. PK063 TaxID=3373602 RepID=UPI003793FAFB
METIPTTAIIVKAVEDAISYADFRIKVMNLALKGATTGPNQTESLIEYTRLNDRRMKRWDKTFNIPNEEKLIIHSFAKKVTWLVITEGWCGDAAHILPVLNAVANENKNISLKVILRDEHEALMDMFLTNGSKAIPKLIVLDENNEVLISWGPRPSAATVMVKDYKEKHGALTAEFKEELQLWYNKDKGKTILKDILKLLISLK